MKRHDGAQVLPQSKGFTVLLAAWSADQEQRGLVVTTRSAYSRAACEYLWLGPFEQSSSYAIAN